MKNSNDLRKKLLCFSTAVVLVPMIILYLMILTFFTKRSVQENERYAFHNIQSISHALDAAFTGLNEMSLYLLVSTPVRSYLHSSSYYQAYPQANSSMQFLPFSSKYFSSASVLSDSRRALVSGTLQEIPITPDDRKKADELLGASFWSIQENDVSLMRLMRDTNRLSDSMGYIKIQVNLPELRELLASPESLPETSYILLTENGVMLQNGDVPPEVLDTPELQFSALTQSAQDSAVLKVDGRTYSYSSRPINDKKVVVISLLDHAKLYQFDSLLLLSIIAAALMTTFFVVVLVTYYTKWVFAPLSKLGAIMINIEHEDFDTQFHIPGNNEITVLVDQFNLMCKRLKLLHEQIYVSELKRKEAEIAILQSEINPHFLYNTLDTIYWMSELSHTWKVSEMVRSLSSLFRISLHKTADGLVPISLEQEYIKGYLTIQQVRYQDQIRFEFYVQEGLGDCKVLKLLLQPIVENAIIHGAEPAGGGKVVINIYREEDAMIYKVFNDGNPVDLAYIQRLLDGDCPENEGFALRNVNARIRLRFGEEYGLTFENPAAGGVLVTVRQPIEEDDV